MPKRNLNIESKQNRIIRAKATNTKERNIAKQYFNSGPSIGNLAKAAYHWWNGIPGLGGEDESGNIVIGGEAPTPGMRNPKTIVKGVKPVIKIVKENATKITPAQWTAAQDAAIAKGDMTEAQRLRDLHFKVKTPGNKIKTKLYHGTNSKPWYRFDINKFSSGTDEGFYGKGLYLTKYPNMTRFYGKNRMNFYVYSKTPLKANFDPTVEIIPSIEYKASYYFNRPEETPFKNKENIFRILKNKDAVSVGDETEVIIANGRNIKSADAVTFDDKGVRIPLGERDNFNINDIRYGLLPIVGGLGAYSVDKKKQGGLIVKKFKLRKVFNNKQKKSCSN